MSLALLAIAYAGMGWYLSAHHILWFVGVLIGVTALVGVLKSSVLFDWLLQVATQNLVIVLTGSLIFSAIIAIATLWSSASILFFVPILTTFLASIELESSGLNSRYKFFYLALIAGLGLFLGEAIDLIIFPSIRY